MRNDHPESCSLRTTHHVPLARALSKLGLASRTEAASLVRDGRVTVDGRIVRDPAQPVVPERIRVEIDGQARKRPDRLTILLHKPRGVVTTRRDPEGRTTVLDLLSDAPARVFPVGRLDLASTGLLLLTNDSRFADWVTDPRHAVLRTYVVTVRGEVRDEDVERLRAGLEAGADGLRPSGVTLRKRSRRETHLVVDLIEGRNREIRRLFEAIGHDVTRLKRVALGGLALGDLVPGKWRVVSPAELAAAFPGCAFAPGASPSALRKTSLTSTKTLV